MTFYSGLFKIATAVIMNVKKSTLVLLASALWFIVGISLMFLGHYYFNLGRQLLPSLAFNGSFSIIAFLTNFLPNPQNAASLCQVLALTIGFIKGRFVLKRTVERQIERIRGLQEKAPITAIYSKNLYFLVVGMILLGMSMKYLPIFYDTRGFIDLAVGFALMNGSFHYTKMLPRLLEKKA